MDDKKYFFSLQIKLVALLLRTCFYCFPYTRSLRDYGYFKRVRKRGSPRMRRRDGSKMAAPSEVSFPPSRACLWFDK